MTEKETVVADCYALNRIMNSRNIKRAADGMGHQGYSVALFKKIDERIMLACLLHAGVRQPQMPYLCLKFMYITCGRLVVSTIMKPGRASPVWSRMALRALLAFSLIPALL